jgi:hypothetical protein
MERSSTPTHPVQILRVSVPSTLLTEYDDLDLDHLRACGHERFLRRRGERLVSVPFVGDDRYGREVLAYLSALTPDMQTTHITDDFEFFVVAGVLEFVLQRPHVVAITKPEPGSNARVIAIQKPKAAREVAEYKLNGVEVRELPSPAVR